MCTSVLKTQIESVRILPAPESSLILEQATGMDPSEDFSKKKKKYGTSGL